MESSFAFLRGRRDWTGRCLQASKAPCHDGMPQGVRQSWILRTGVVRPDRLRRSASKRRNHMCDERPDHTNDEDDRTDEDRNHEEDRFSVGSTNMLPEVGSEHRDA